jgi:hypothetical protein
MNALPPVPEELGVELCVAPVDALSDWVLPWGCAEAALPLPGADAPPELEFATAAGASTAMLLSAVVVIQRALARTSTSFVGLRG